MRILQLLIVIGFIGFYIIIAPRIVVRRDYSTLKLLIIEICLQNLVCIIASNVTNKSIAQFIILYKEIVMYGGIIYYFVIVKKGKFKKIIIPIATLIIVCLLFFFIGDAGIYTRFISLRQILTPIVMILYGFTFEKSKIDNRKLLTFIVNLGMAHAIFGFVERFILGDRFWIALHIEKYMEYKGFAHWVFGRGVPGDFYSADLYAIFGSVRRLAGIFTADPILTAHFLAFSIVILLYVNIFERKKNVIYLVTMTVALLLTLCKGAILIVGIAYWYRVYKQNKAVGIISVGIPIAVVIYIITQDVFDTVSIHINGLTSSLGTEYLIGKGIGTSGNLARAFGGSSSTAGESYIGTLIGQMGILGLLSFVFMITSLSRQLIRGNKSRLSYAIFAYIIAVLIESFMSESAINFVGSGVAFIIFGKMVAESKELKRSARALATNTDYYPVNRG